MKIKKLLFILFLFSGCYEDNFDYSDADSLPVDLKFRAGCGKSILILGDSRGEQGGTFDYLENPVFNAAQGRSTIDGIINRLYVVDSINPDVIILFTGANDPAHMSASEYAEKLFYVISYCESRGAKVIITNPWSPEMSRVLLSDERIWKTFIFLTIISSYNNYIDTTGIYPQYFYDGIHLNDDGYYEICKIISRGI